MIASLQRRVFHSLSPHMGRPGYPSVVVLCILWPFVGSRWGLLSRQYGVMVPGVVVLHPPLTSQTLSMPLSCRLSEGFPFFM